MSNILVSGLINIETTLQCDEFPIHYSPVRYPFFGIQNTISGVGYNVAKALTLLSDTVHLVSIIGKDKEGEWTTNELKSLHIDTQYITPAITQTPQSVILFDKAGKRQIHVDLKDIQDTTYPIQLFEKGLASCNIVALCNINFSRPMLAIAKQQGKLIATDVHVLADIHDPYNVDFMQHADILFLSNEKIMGNEKELIHALASTYHNQLIVVGMGAEGALLYQKTTNTIQHLPAVYTRPIINTIGAGDALFSCFLHYYAKGEEPINALRKAILFASYKIGENGAANGFLSEKGLEEILQNLAKKS
jgi:acarbose 7IV-phosphotransferase